MAMDVALGYSRQAPQTLDLDGYSFTAEWPQRLLWTLGAKGAVVTVGNTVLLVGEGGDGTMGLCFMPPSSPW